MIKNKLLNFLSIIIFFVIWQLFVQWQHYPEFILPSPLVILKRFIEVFQSGILTYHAWATLQEILGGLIVGLSIAFTLGYLLAKSPLAEQMVTPLIVALQAVPIIALAPLLVIWFGTDIEPKILVSAIVLFFPVLVNTVVGFRRIDRNLLDLMRSLGASRLQQIIWLDLPSGLPIFIGSLKIGVTLSVIGAIVGEFVASDRGLGFLINLAGGLYDTPLRFVAFFTLSLMALILYWSVNILERKVVKWKTS